MDAFTTAFGTHLRQLRKDLGLSQEELSHRVGIHVSYLSGIERGLRNPSLKNIRRMATALEIPVGELFSFEERSR